jgi:branched-chain amino acid transport system substrate-binding protein
VSTHPRLLPLLACVAAIAAALIASACGSTSSASSTLSNSSAGSSPGNTATSAAAKTASCGPKPGVKATGSPIILGAIATKQPGLDFTDPANMAHAYFNCVNDNGGVNGHPIRYFIETEQSNPGQVAAAARQLVQSDHVMGIVGAFSLIECTVDRQYWQKLGYYEIDSGIAPECYSTSNSAAVNMGPRFSSDGAVQYAISQHAGKIVFDNSNVPDVGYTFAGVQAVAAAAHTPVTTLTENEPITDPNSIALHLANDAGSNGAVVLDFSPPSDLAVLQAAQKLGITDRVKLWGCSTPCNTDFVAAALGPKWNHKLFINAELTPTDSTNSATMALYRAILKQYGSAVSGGVGSFSQMGFTEAEIAVHALEAVQGAYTSASVNQALRSVKNFDTGMLCQPWTYGSYSAHLPNNTDYTTTPANGKLVLAQGCTGISSADPQVAAYHKLAG